MDVGKKYESVFENYMSNPLVSIIIVHYKVEKELFSCIDSILASNVTSYEIIVVDNDEVSSIEKELKKKFPNVIYKKAPRNLGYGGGNNYGSQFAKGKYLFFLNPDTILQKNTISVLVRFLQKEKNAGIVAPLFLDSKNKPYPLQGSTILTPFVAIMCLSFIQKLFPNNPTYKKYYYFSWDKKSIKEVDVAPGTAFLVKKSIFDEAGGFDEQFFLFFEENDFCLRVKKLGFNVYINPEAKLVHLWGESTKSLPNTKEIFKKSRKYYFQKHFGLFWALMVELFCK